MICYVKLNAVWGFLRTFILQQRTYTRYNNIEIVEIATFEINRRCFVLTKSLGNIFIRTAPMLRYRCQTSSNYRSQLNECLRPESNRYFYTCKKSCSKSITDRLMFKFVCFRKLQLCFICGQEPRYCCIIIDFTPNWEKVLGILSETSARRTQKANVVSQYLV